VYLEATEAMKAAELFAKGHALEPFERSWLTDLVRVHGQLGNTEEQIKYLAKLVRGDGDDLDSRKRLARLSSALNKHAEAERWAREALEIDVNDGETKMLLFTALEEQKKTDELMRLRKLLGK